ncbi:MULTISPECIES: wax ester/triacylglycerol synthase domain-containing protein [unclassified Nonomuraea]|uniref:wax ester/triacylglycerol synthase domain-containing protein n=1 Tax=unclassified Nonomuraea TaxID=2593643 RepID=UPI0033E26283
MFTANRHSIRDDADEMSPKDQMVWRLETGHRARPVILAIMEFDGPLDWQELITWHEGLIALMPRMRAKVVNHRGLLRRSHWTPDPDFELSHHLKRVPVKGKGLQRDLLDTAETLAEVPFKHGRSPWDGYLIEGLDGGRSAYLLKISHSMADGIRLRELFLRHAANDATHAGADWSVIDPMLPPAPPQREKRSWWDLARRGGKAGWFLAQAGRDMLNLPHPVPPADGHFARRFYTTVVPLAPFKQLALAGGGTVHDALVAAVMEGCRRYNQHHRTARRHMRVFSPYGRPPTGGGHDPALAGNHWFIVRFAVPGNVPEITDRIAMVRNAVKTAYHRDSIDWMGAIATLSPLIPQAVFETAFLRLCASHDFVVSNMAGPDAPLSIGRAQATQIYAIAPTLGSALTVTLLSYRHSCHLTVNIDPNVIRDSDLLGQCVAESLAVTIS